MQECVGTHRRAFADEAMWGVAGDGTGPSVATWLSFTSIKHCVTALTYRGVIHRQCPSLDYYPLVYWTDISTRYQMSPSVSKLNSKWLESFPSADGLLTCVSRATLAAVVVGELDAAVRAPRVTGVGKTLIDISLTALPDVSRGADAVVASDSIHTLPFVETLGLFGDWVGERVAVVDVDLAVHT